MSRAQGRMSFALRPSAYGLRSENTNGESSALGTVFCAAKRAAAGMLVITFSFGYGVVK